MKINFKLILLSFFVALFLSSCSGANTKVDTPKGDITGNGLEIDFDIDEGSIAHGELIYYIGLQNTGKDPITLTRNNFKFNTLQVTNEDVNQPVFTQDSLDSFFNRVLANNELVLYQNAKEIELDGVLVVLEDLLIKPKFDTIKYSLDVNYDYKTDFSNTVLVELFDVKKKLKIQDELSQAAPVKIYEIELEAARNNEYEIKYKIRKQDNDAVAVIKDINIVFGANNKLSDCFAFADENDNKARFDRGDEIKLDDDLSNIVYVCTVNLGDVERSDSTTFITSGTIEYNYKIIEEGEFRLPDLDEVFVYDRN